MPLAQHIEDAVRASVKETPLGPDEVHGFTGFLREQGVFISRMDVHNSWPRIGSVEMGKKDVVHVFQAKMA